MALTFGFYNSIDGDRVYDALQFGQIFDGIITDGVYATYKKGMVVRASDNAGEVIIQPGRAWFNHTWTNNDSDYVMTALTPPLLSYRIDALVLDINVDEGASDGRTNSFKWVQGTESTNPERPTLTNTAMHHQYPLAYIKRHPETVTIKTADITSAIGTSECPFAAGVLKGIDLDMWINQWDAAFNDWYRDVRQEFEVWMTTEMVQYNAWSDTIKAQMSTDLADTEAWVLSIQNVIDSQAASRLQAEIDDLQTKVVHGSNLKITTDDSALFNRNITITDPAGTVFTSKFDNTGLCEVESMPLTGDLTVECTDGVQTATTALSVPYFGNYECELGLFAAVINITGIPESIFGGEIVKIKKNGTTIANVPLNSIGKGTYTLKEPGTYTFTCEF